MELVPEGFYDAVVAPVAGEDGSVPVQFSEPQEGKFPQVLVNFEILAGPYQSRTVPWWGSFSPKIPDGSKAKQSPIQRTLQSLRYCGWTGDDVMDAINQELGNKVSIQVEHHEWEGKVNARVSWVNRPGGGGIVMKNQMSKDSLRRFSASLKGVARSIPAVAGNKAERGSAPPAQGDAWSGNDAPDPPKDRSFDQSPPRGSDDDIPF